MGCPSLCFEANKKHLKNYLTHPLLSKIFTYILSTYTNKRVKHKEL